jgi:hypothetical protein
MLRKFGEKPRGMSPMAGCAAARCGYTPASLERNQPLVKRAPSDHPSAARRFDPFGARAAPIRTALGPTNVMIALSDWGTAALAARGSF